MLHLSTLPTSPTRKPLLHLQHCSAAPIRSVPHLVHDAPLRHTLQVSPVTGKADFTIADWQHPRSFGRHLNGRPTPRVCIPHSSDQKQHGEIQSGQELELPKAKTRLTQMPVGGPSVGNGHQFDGHGLFTMLSETFQAKKDMAIEDSRLPMGDVRWASPVSKPRKREQDVGSHFPRTHCKPRPPHVFTLAKGPGKSSPG